MPTSQEFHSVPLDKVSVREDRARRTFGKIDELADSIRRNGLIHPIIVTRDHVLVAGERRLRAHQQLGLEKISVHYFDELDPFDAKIVELEENLRRLDLTWQENCNLVAEYHEARASAGEKWSAADTAQALGLTRTHIVSVLAVARELAAGNPAVARAETQLAAKNIVQRKRARTISAEAAKITGSATRAKTEEEAQGVSADVFAADFIEWSANYTGERFNFVHCDFPYGIGYDATKYGGSASWAKYKDSKDLFLSLLFALLKNKDRIFHSSAHLVFWFSMNYYPAVLDALVSGGFVVNPFPLIWYKDRGIIPDPARGPRRVYETAFFASLGDRKILSAVPNLVQSPVRKITHISEKPFAVLVHFFKMFVDDLSLVLDPTCGSGNALAAAKVLGANRLVGIDIEGNYVEATKELLRKTRALGEIVI